jgi:hypothetical protein
MLERHFSWYFDLLGIKKMPHALKGESGRSIAD